MVSVRNYTPEIKLKFRQIIETDENSYYAIQTCSKHFDHRLKYQSITVWFDHSITNILSVGSCDLNTPFLIQIYSHDPNSTLINRFWFHISKIF